MSRCGKISTQLTVISDWRAASFFSLYFTASLCFFRHSCCFSNVSCRKGLHTHSAQLISKPVSQVSLWFIMRLDVEFD